MAIPDAVSARDASSASRQACDGGQGPPHEVPQRQTMVFDDESGMQAIRAAAKSPCGRMPFVQRGTL
ncbi:hypothetical protein [Pseudoxanthomonas sp.]|jgi:hypothetical protein|uniref:hypothetical protein n=1 Tax=Pseudoxanthomonas sp. TaxID=1871049 RepID=UPI002E0E6676|nr:hypothetical protein [Pseudoxanthomonas sp.]